MTIKDNIFGNKKKLIQENKVLKQEIENLHKLELMNILQLAFVIGLI